MGLTVQRVELPLSEIELLTPEIRRSGSHALVKLSGELDTSTAGSLYEQFAELSRDGVVHVALDLSDLSFMDSTGLSVVIAEHKRVASLGGELVVLDCQSMVARLFEVTGLYDILDIRPNRGSADGTA